MAGKRVRLAGGALAAAVALAACGDGGRPALVDDSTRDASGRIVDAGQVGVLQLRPGDCFVSGADAIEYVAAVPCEDAHDSEVLAVFDLDDAAWPGTAAVEDAARIGCLERFEAATGFALDSGITELTAYAPTHASWTDDRSVICVAITPDGGLVHGALTRPTA
jgi:hypothetical protein